MIDTSSNSVIASIPLGQAPQGVAYVPDAVETSDGLANLQPPSATSDSVRLSLGARTEKR